MAKGLSGPPWIEEGMHDNPPNAEEGAHVITRVSSRGYPVHLTHPSFLPPRVSSRGYPKIKTLTVAKVIGPLPDGLPIGFLQIWPRDVHSIGHPEN